ncbi:hypothetical protein QBC38DRAFT_469834 [Podospora fimiseda]|uniref:CCZ1/INTU/HSP4 first Longin domain-containing protein n=1 Tax=Podospora fimiseda TaxID=252190 RepID=A0AAN7BWG7_9PEZI|nr:hypothetical protein QBC38DRAFT_469834 [Podospora fimiseda]
MASPTIGTASQQQPQPHQITPAQLGFLSLYNPSLSSSREDQSSLFEQIVYYNSVKSQSSFNRQQQQRKKRQDAAGGAGDEGREEMNEQLRQIGLAQGMIEFAKGFSRGKSVEVVDTEGRRVVLKELEPGWWVLASIDLTKLSESEYSSREVKPATLLLQDLLRAHAVFLLHHDSSLSSLYVRIGREKFVSILKRYWDGFVAGWNVLLCGNPAVGIFGGIKIAACGELGIGVGEEERGSGEREVLEGLVGRIEGLVDVVVGRFGTDESSEENGDTEIGGEDGAVFLGVNALSRKSLRAICWWMEDIYLWGENAYGVGDSPSATREEMMRRRRRRRRRMERERKAKEEEGKEEEEGVMSGNEGGGSMSGMNNLFGYLTLGYGTSWSLSGSPSKESTLAKVAEQQQQLTRPPLSRRTLKDVHSGNFLIGFTGDVDNGGSGTDESGTPGSADHQEEVGNSRTLLRTLTVELEQEGDDLPEYQKTKDLGSQDTELALTPGSKEENDEYIPDTTSTTFDSQDRNKTKKLRVVVYVNKPFIYVFLFELRTHSLALEGFYKSLHMQLTPLHKPLLVSTRYRPERPDTTGDESSTRTKGVSAASAQIYDLVWDPVGLTIHSTLPNIPEPWRSHIPNPVLSSSKNKRMMQWNRVEAINTHNQILNIIGSTRSGGDAQREFERTCKTSRGWWIVWTRILEGNNNQRGGIQGGGSSGGGGGGDSTALTSESGNYEGEEEENEIKVTKEILLIRKAGDGSGHGGHGGHGSSLGGSVSAVVASATGGEGKKDGGGSGGSGGGGWTDGASRLAQGIGVDTRRYIEGLLSMNR